MQNNTLLKQPAFYVSIIGILAFLMPYFRISTFGVGYSLNGIQLMTFDGDLGKFENMVIDKSPIVYFSILIPVFAGILLLATAQQSQKLKNISKWLLFAVSAFFILYFSLFFLKNPGSKEGSGLNLNLGKLLSYGPGFGLIATFALSLLLLFEEFILRLFIPSNSNSSGKDFLESSAEDEVLEGQEDASEENDPLDIFD